MSNSIELAFGHSQDDIATTFCIAKLLFANRGHFATIDPVPDLNFFVASVGLNANSTAVVIGAMLISPLMGPILGVGMSIALMILTPLESRL